MKVIALRGIVLSRDVPISYNSYPEPMWLFFKDDDSDRRKYNYRLESNQDGKQEAKVALNKNINVRDIDHRRTAAITECRIEGVVAIRRNMPSARMSGSIGGV